MGFFGRFGLWIRRREKNYRSESLQIKFIGFVLTCRCATGPFFAHWADFDLTTGQKWAFLAVLDFESVAEKKLPVRITPNQVYWIRLDIYMCNGPLFCPLGRFWLAHGHETGSATFAQFWDGSHWETVLNFFIKFYMRYLLTLCFQTVSAAAAAAAAARFGTALIEKPFWIFSSNFKCSTCRRGELCWI